MAQTERDGGIQSSRAARTRTPIRGGGHRAVGMSEDVRQGQGQGQGRTVRWRCSLASDLVRAALVGS